MKFENIEVTSYPDFDEYKLLNIFPIEEVRFRRGNRYENLFAEDYLLWQDYFCIDYVPPKEKKIAFFHCCSWAKPYDFSFIIRPIKKIADKYNDVHRIIMSNVGVVPYEFQMNPTFCAYDFPPTIDTKGMYEKEVSKERIKYFKIHYERVYRYLNSHKYHYEYIITLANPINYGMCALLAIICKELHLKHINVIDKDLYNKYKEKKYEDITEMYIEEDVLHKLDSVLSDISRSK